MVIREGLRVVVGKGVEGIGGGLLGGLCEAEEDVAEYVRGRGICCAPCLDCIPRVDDEAGDRLSEGGRAGRDFSLSNFRAMLVEENSGDEWSSWGVIGSGMLSVEAVDGVLRTSSLLLLERDTPLDEYGMFDFGVRVATVVGSSDSCSCSGMLTSREKWDPALLVLVRPLTLPPFDLPACRFCHAVGGRDERDPEEDDDERVLDMRGW